MFESAPRRSGHTDSERSEDLRCFSPDVGRLREWALATEVSLRLKAVQYGRELMCPACMARAALMVAGVVSTGGLTALAARLFHSTTPPHSKSTTDQIWPKEPKRKEQ